MSYNEEVKFTEFEKEFRPFKGKGDLKGNVIYRRKDRSSVENIYVDNAILERVTDDTLVRLVPFEHKGAELIKLEALIWY